MSFYPTCQVGAITPVVCGVIETANVTGAGQVTWTGTGFGTGTCNAVTVEYSDVLGSQSYFDPAGPCNFLNPVTAVISWTDTMIVVTDSATLSGHTAGGSQFIDVDDPPCVTIEFDINPNQPIL